LSFDQLIQLLYALGAIIGAALGAWRAAKSGKKDQDEKDKERDKKLEAVLTKQDEVMGKLQSYVTVAEYREKTAGLHAEINELRTRLAVYEDRERR
jgi:gas vesicle protein